MKQLTIILLLILISTMLSGALGEIKKIELTRGETTTVDLDVKDAVELDMMGGRHIITVNKITSKGADLDIFNYVDGKQKTMYASTTKKQTVKLDFDRDGKGEVYIKFNRFLDDSGVALDFYYATEEDFKSNTNTNQITGDIIAETDSQNGMNIRNSMSMGLLILGLLLTGTLLILLFVNKKHN